MAFLLSVAACGSESEFPTCPVTNGEVLEFGDGAVCGVTPTGLILRSVGSTLVLDRVTEQGTLQEVAQIETDSLVADCGAVAQDPESEAIWVVAPQGGGHPDHLLKLDANGQQLYEESLSYEGTPVYADSLFARAGELYLGGTIYVDQGSQTALLERRDSSGALVWQQVGLGDQDDVEPIVGLEEGIAILARIYGGYTSPSSITTLSIDDETGLPVWSDATIDDSSYFFSDTRLSSDGTHAMLITEEHERFYEYVGGPVQAPATSRVTARDHQGEIVWQGEVEWPEHDELRVTQAVDVATSFFHVVSGRDVDDELVYHVALARQDSSGVVDCKTSLDHLEMIWSNSLYKLDDERLVLVGESVLEENPDDPYYPHEQPAIVVLEVEP